MLIEILGVAFAFTLGWLCLRILAPTTGFAFVISASFPIGVAVWLVASMTLIAVMVPFNPVAGLLLGGLVIGICNYAWGERPTRHECVMMAIGYGCILSITFLFAMFEWSILNADTRWTLHMADNLVDSGFISPPMRQTQIGAEPMYLPLVSAYARWFGQIYFISLSPLMVTCTGALFAVFGLRAAKPLGGQFQTMQFWLPLLGAIALVSTGFYIINALQTKTHAVYALHMLGACAALYFACREGSRAWFYIALLFTVPMVLIRLETGVSALPILVVAVAVTNIQLKQRLLGVGSVALAWGLSYAYLLGAITYSSTTGGFDRGLFPKKLFYIGFLPGLFGVALIMTAYAIRHGKHFALIDRLADMLPIVMISVLFSILVGHLIILPETLGIAMGGFRSILTDPHMGGIGYGVAVIVMLTASLLTRPKVPCAWTVMVPVVSYVFFLILADIHLDGFPHWGPTGAITRISSHVLPAMFFYVVLRLIASDKDYTHSDAG